MSTKISLIVIILFVMTFIVYLIIKDKIKVEFGLLWIAAFLTAGLIVLSDKMLSMLTKLVGGIYPTAGITVLAIGFVFLVLIVFTAYLTKVNDDIKKISRTVSFLERKIRQLEEEKRDSGEN
jgi:hypothetical protein